MKKSSKIFKRRNVSRHYLFTVVVSIWRGVTKLEAFHWGFVMKLNTPKPSPFCRKLKGFFHIWLHCGAFQVLSRKA